MPGDRCGDVALETAHRGSGDLVRRSLGLGFLPGDHHVGLQNHAFQVDAVTPQLCEHLGQHLVGDRLAALLRVTAVHQYFGLHDRHDVLFLAERGIARQCVCIGFDGKARRYAITNIDHRAPLGKARPELVVLDHPLAQAIEALGDGLARKGGQRLGAGVDLDARDDAQLGQVVRERDAVAGLLADGLIVHDHAADPLRDSRGREQQFAIAATVLFGGLAADLGQALGNGANCSRRPPAAPCPSPPSRPPPVPGR